MGTLVNLPRLLIAAPASGAGKTTITVGLIAALAQSMQVQPFKVGPDYIDPMYHTLAAGRSSRNLDSWMMSGEVLFESFSRASAGTDIAVIEGVMGLFDGAGSDTTGSSAEIARLLNVPVILVIDVSAMSGSAGAVARGFRDHDPALTLAGVICNRVGGERHAEWVRAAVESTGIPVLGCVPYNAALQVPERHLGLHLAEEHEAFIEQARTWVQRHIDLERIRTLAQAVAPLNLPTGSVEQTPAAESRTRIAVAQDAAFCFYYADNLDQLRGAGSEIIPFSPLAGDMLPPNVSGVYLGGGYPELHASALAANHRLRAQLQYLARQDFPVYAECGGMMALTQALIDADGHQHTMFGVIPGVVCMGKRFTLGYRVVTALQSTLLLDAGETARGHEFHFSNWDLSPHERNAYLAAADTTQSGSPEGWSQGNLLAAYTHLHFASNPRIAERFVDACVRWQHGGTQPS
jgi:cobyrinic acid a,c-diamide synthase